MDLHLFNLLDPNPLDKEEIMEQILELLWETFPVVLWPMFYFVKCSPWCGMQRLEALRDAKYSDHLLAPQRDVLSWNHHVFFVLYSGSEGKGHETCTSRNVWKLSRKFSDLKAFGYASDTSLLCKMFLALKVSSLITGVAWKRVFLTHCCL